VSKKCSIFVVTSGTPHTLVGPAPPPLYRGLMDKLAQKADELISGGSNRTNQQGYYTQGQGYGQQPYGGQPSSSSSMVGNHNMVDSNSSMAISPCRIISMVLHPSTNSRSTRLNLTWGVLTHHLGHLQIMALPRCLMCTQDR